MLSPPICATTFSGPHKFRQAVNFAHQCALERRPFAIAEEAAEGLSWSSGPAGKRASLALDEALAEAYRAGQIAVARTAVAALFADNPDAPDIESACIAAACATEAKDGDWSTLITASDVAGLIGQHIEIAEPDNAEWLAECALRDFHTGWPEPTPESERARAESVAAVEAHLARIANAPDPFDPAQRPPLPPADPEREAAFRAACLHRAARWDEAREMKTYLRRVEMPIEGLGAVQDVMLESRIEAWEREDAYWAAQTAKERHAPEQDASPADQPESFDLATEPGLLGDIARWSQTYAFRPVAEFAQISALAVLAPLFARRWATPTGSGLNLYMIGLAPTASGKEALIGAPQAALAAAGCGHLVGAGDFTSDSAIEVALRARPNFLAPIDEVGEFVGSAQHKMAASHSRTIRKALLDLYGKSKPDGRWTGKQKADPENDKAGDPVFAPSLSILGASTAEGFFSALTEANLADGFINRLLVVQGGKPAPRNLDPARLVVPDSIVGGLRAAYEVGGGGNLSPLAGRTATMKPDMPAVPWEDDAAQTEWLAVCDWQDAAEEAGRGGITGRAAEHTLKIATLRALARNPAGATVTAGDVRWAWALVRGSVEALEKAAAANLGASEFELLVQAIERAAVEAGPVGIAWSKLLERRGVSKHTPKMVEAALERLKERQAVSVGITTGPQGGRPGKRVRATVFD